MKIKNLFKVIFSIILMFVCFAYVKAATIETHSQTMGSPYSNNLYYRIWAINNTGTETEWVFSHKTPDSDNPTAGVWYLYYVKGSGNKAIYCAELGKGFPDTFNDNAYTDLATISSGIPTQLYGQSCALNELFSGPASWYQRTTSASNDAGTSSEKKSYTIADSKKSSIISVASSDKELYNAVQNLVWKYQNTTNGKTCNVVTYKSNEVTKTKPEVSLDTDKAVFATGDYYEKDFTLKVTNASNISGNLNISLDTSADLKCSKIGETGTSTKSISYSCLIPKNKYSQQSIKINYSFNYTKKAYTTHYPYMRRYNTTSNDDQNLIEIVEVTKNETESGSDSGQLSTTLTIGHGSISIIKYNSQEKKSENNKFVEGAVFHLMVKSGSKYVDAVDIYGNVVKDVTTDDEGGAKFENLPYGTYKIVEVSAPEGFELDDKESEEIVLNSTKSTSTIDFTNTPKNIKISKKDITKEGELKGAEICIYKASINGTTVKKEDKVLCFKSGEEKGFENKPYEFYISPGEYVLVENAAPAGYEKLENEFVFKITDEYKIERLTEKDNNIDTKTERTIIVYNQKIEVPDTGKAAMIAYSVIGTILIASGGILIYLVKKKKKLIEQI